MGIYISGVKFNSELRPNKDLKYLLGVIGEKITVSTSFYFEDITYSTSENDIIQFPNGSEVDLFDTNNIIYSVDLPAFSEMYVGDTLGVYNSSGGGSYNYYTITEKINDNTVRINNTFSTRHVLHNDSFVFNATPFAGVRYAFNMINNLTDFNSIIDGEYQKAQIPTADTTNTTPVTMQFTGSKAYQYGTITIKGDGGAGGGGVLGQFVQQKFTITHNTIISPLFLATQYEDLNAKIKPSYFNANECLNYFSNISLGRNLTDPNGLQSIDVPSLLANTGWFNENFNGGNTNYSVGSLTIKDGTTIIDDLQFDKDITVEIVINNTVDSPFSNNNTKFVFGFNYLPESEQLQALNTRTQDKNYLIDSKLNTIGSISANGANFGNSMQVIKTVVGTFVSSSQIKVTAVIRFGSEAKAIMSQGDFLRYHMWVITENHNLSATVSDTVNLSAKIGEIDEQLIQSNLIINEGIGLVFHPYDDTTTSQDNKDVNVHPVDDVVVHFPFKIDFNGHAASEGIKIVSVRNKIVLVDSANTDPDIILDEFTINSEGYPIIGGKAQDIDYSQDRVFKFANGDIRKTIKFNRNYSLDTANEKYYTILYPFMMRWEYWQKLILNSYPTQIFDVTKNFNGLNNFWERLATVGTYEIKYQASIKILQNGIEFEQDFEKDINVQYTYDENPEWENNGIKSYDVNNNLLTVGGTKYLQGFTGTKLVAEFEKVSGGLPSLQNFGVVFTVEVFENGGIVGSFNASSFRDIPVFSPFYNTTNKVDLSITGNKYLGTVFLDGGRLPQGDKYTVYARIYDFYNLKAKQFEDGNDFQFEDGQIFEFEPNSPGKYDI